MQHSSWCHPISSATFGEGGPPVSRLARAYEASEPLWVFKAGWWSEFFSSLLMPAPNSPPTNVAAHFSQPQGPTTLVSLLFMPMITHTTFPAPRGAQEGEPTPTPPTSVQPDQLEPL